MKKYTEIRSFLELPADATRQYIDAGSAFSAYEEARDEAAQVRGGMYWHNGPKTAPEKSYLVRTSPTGGEKSLGARTPDTQRIYNAFQQRKAQAEERLVGLKESLIKHQRMNRALKVGRVAPIIIQVLNRLQDCGLAEHFRVVGTHAIYAFEAAAGVRVEDGAVATHDIDFLWDVRKRVAFTTALSRTGNSMLAVLRKVDPTFRIRNSQKYTAVNKDGFEIDIIRRTQAAGDPHPIRLSQDEDDFWVAQAPRAQELLDAAPFSAMIVGTDGSMARLNTLEPMAFVSFKMWMSALPDRDPLKRRRDAIQANVVEALVEEYLPHWRNKSPSS